MLLGLTSWLFNERRCASFIGRMSVRVNILGNEESGRV